MAKTLFFIRPMFGHVNPALGLARELVSCGEQVIFYSSATFKERIQSSGALFRGLPQNGENLNRGTANYVSRDTWLKTKSASLEAQVSYFYHEIAAQVEDAQKQLPNLLAETIRENPQYIVYDYRDAYWGKILAQEARIPAIATIPSLALCQKLLDLNPLDCFKYIFNISPETLTGVNSAITPKDLADLLSYKISATFALKTFDIMDFGNSNLLNIVYTSPYFHPHAQAFDSTFKFIGASITPPQDPGEFPFDRLDNHPLIYISMGTLCDLPQQFFQACFDAFKTFPQKVVLAYGNNKNKAALAQLSIPSNFIIQQYVPQFEILKRANLFFSHGGMNSVTDAIYHKVPMILYPQVFEQFAIADRVQTLGAGISIGYENLSPTLLRLAAQTILTQPRFLQNCEKIKQSIDSAGGVQRAAQEICNLKKNLNPF